MPADVIDYRLIGDDLQAVIVTLDPGEGVIAEAGAMMYMEEIGGARSSRRRMRFSAGRAALT
jgi:uncharacterized protein (AIM24 family)